MKAKIKVDIYDEIEDPEPARTMVIEASSEEEAIEKVRDIMRQHEKRADASTFILDESQLGGPDKLG